MNVPTQAKISGMEAFLTQYPNSVMKEDALELLMRTYQQLNNVPKTMEAANRVLQANPNNVTALALLSYLNRLKAQSEQGAAAQQDLQQAAQFGEKGLQALPNYPKPEGMSDVDFAKLKDSLSGIFNGSNGPPGMACMIRNVRIEIASRTPSMPPSRISV